MTPCSSANTLRLPRVVAVVFRGRDFNRGAIIVCIAKFILARKRQNKLYILVKTNISSAANNHVMRKQNGHGGNPPMCRRGVTRRRGVAGLG